MPILPSREHEIDTLVARLGSTRAAEREAAVARLTLAGERAVGPLLRLVPEAPPAVLLGALAVIERLLPRRALKAVLALCRHADAAVAGRAVITAAAFADPEAIAQLRECVARPEEDVSRQAVRALLSLHAGGHDEAFEPLVDVLLDESAADHARLAAAGLLAQLPEKDGRALLGRLQKSRNAVLAAHIQDVARPLASAAPRLPRILRRIPGAAFRGKKPALAGGSGQANVPALIAELETGGVSAPLLQRIQGLLVGHGPAARPAVHAALAGTDAPGLMAALADVLSKIGTNASIPVLASALRRLSPAGGHEAPRARARLHLALAALASRIALYDLREALAVRPPREIADLLAAASAIGDVGLLPALAALAHDLPGLTALCKETVAVIVRRERPRRDSRVLRQIPAPHRAALEALWPRRASGRK